MVDGLLPFLSTMLGVEVDAIDLFAYLTAAVAHPAFTNRFAPEMETSVLRVPLTADGAVFTRGVVLGHRVLWLQTLGGHHALEHGHTRSLEPLQGEGDAYPHLDAPIPHVASLRPETVSYDASTRLLHVGNGVVANVEPQVWSYEVGGVRVVEQWLAQRVPAPSRRRQSPLDLIVPAGWEAGWTTELLQLLHAITRLRTLEPAQRGLLDEVLDGPLISVADLAAADLSLLPSPEAGSEAGEKGNGESTIAEVPALAE